MEIKKDHWYWVRYKYGPTVQPGLPYTMMNGKVAGWSLPFWNRIGVEKVDEIEVVAEIPFPDGWGPAKVSGWVP